MKERKSALEPRAAEDERVVEPSLRPGTFAEFVGQERIKENLEIAIVAAKTRSGVLDHVLFHGPPGLGKTSLAHLVAAEMGATIRTTSGPALERAGDLVAVLTNLQEGDVFFVDEIHRLSRVVEEVLYPALDERKVDLVIGQGTGARTVRFDLRPFTLIGATTRMGLLSRPLRSRFGADYRLEPYGETELVRILERSARTLGVDLDDEGAAELARASRGTPRIANRLLRSARDFAVAKGLARVDRSVARARLDLLEIDLRGLDAMDRAILSTVVEKFGGGPVGLGTIAAAIGEEADTLEEVHEPFLIQQGYLKRTPQGRVATAHAFELLGCALPTAAQRRLL